MAIKERTEVVQDKIDPDKVCVVLVTELNPKFTERTTLRVEKKRIRTLIKQLKAWL